MILLTFLKKKKKEPSNLLLLMFLSRAMSRKIHKNFQVSEFSSGKATFTDVINSFISHPRSFVLFCFVSLSLSLFAFEGRKAVSFQKRQKKITLDLPT